MNTRLTGKPADPAEKAEVLAQLAAAREAFASLPDTEDPAALAGSIYRVLGHEVQHHGAAHPLRLRERPHLPRVPEGAPQGLSRNQAGEGAP